MKESRNCIYIPSIDAKDLYLANNFKNQDKEGYKLLTKKGDINYNRFINSLDFSLDSEEIRKIVKKHFPKNYHLTFINKGKEYSDKIINVTFKYSSKGFNKVKKNTYIKDEYNLNDLIFEDCIAIDEEDIVGIIVDTPVQQNTNLTLPKCFSYVENMDGDMVYHVSNPEVLKSRQELREELYEKGFYCNGNHYVRLKRTSGSARVGKCLFVEEKLYPFIHEWEMCGLKIAEGDEVDLAALESYISLPTSSAIDIIHINPKSILIIPDYESKFTEDSIIVGMDKNNRITVNEGMCDIGNSIFDGQSLIDISAMDKYCGYGMILLRNRFFKSCCFNTNIQQWFKNNNITDLSQLHENCVTIADSIEDIKIITTPKSIKYTKFSTLYEWLRNICDEFSVVKHEKKTHFFNGRLVQTHYQLLNTLQLSPEEVERLVTPSLDYVNKLNTDYEVFKHHIGCSIVDENLEVSNVFKDKNDICYTMMCMSDKFKDTKYFYDFKKNLCRSYLNNLKKGHILIDGNYSVLFGNPYEMLLHSIGKFDGTTTLPVGHVHTSRYPYGKKLLCCRSPHITTSNLLVTENIEHNGIDKYFNLSEEIICVNSIGENILEVLSGADFDSDMVIVTDNEIIIEAALKNYDVFKVPANRVPSVKVKRTYTNKQKADLDFKTSENKIGEIVNLSQELNTLTWDIINRSGKTPAECWDEIKDIYYDICILNVLSCIEIDKAKKEFDISSTTEINEIKEKWSRETFDNKKIKPAFLGFIAQTKGYKNTDTKKYNYHKTTMDYLLKCINKRRSDKTEVKNVLLSECFKPYNYNILSVNRRQIRKVIEMCETVKSSINAVWTKKYYSKDEKYLISDRYKEDLCYDFQSLKINESTLYELIACTDNPKYSHISKLLFYLLFNYKNETIIDMMYGLKTENVYLVEDDDGDIQLYGIKYKKIKEKIIEEK